MPSHRANRAESGPQAHNDNFWSDASDEERHDYYSAKFDDLSGDSADKHRKAKVREWMRNAERLARAIYVIDRGNLDQFEKEVHGDRELRQWAAIVGPLAIRQTWQNAVDSVHYEEEARAKREEKMERAIDATPWEFLDPTNIPEREWLLGTTYLRQDVTATIAPGGAGKTALGTTQALSMATGKPLLSDEAPMQGPLRVWLVNLEDPKVELDRRIAAACKHYGITEADLAGRLFVDGCELEIVVAEESKDGLKICTPVVDAVKETIRKRRIDVLLIDPFISSHRIGENDNTRVDAVVKAWKRIAVETGCAIGLSHHTRKGAPGQVGFDAEDARGAVALINACRKVLVLNRMPAELARKLAIEDAWRYFRVDDAKQNLSPPAAKAVWRKLASVPLGNKQKLDGDNVQVVETWTLPEATDDVSADDIERVLAAIGDGEWRKDAQAKDWIGVPIAEALEWDLNRPESAASIKAMIKEWLANGTLKTAKRKDGNRKAREFVFLNRTKGEEGFAEDLVG